MSKDITPQVIHDAIQKTIKYECEKVIQKAVKDCDDQIRQAVNDAAISIAKMARYEMNGNELLITVKYGERK